jgi:hypothetical protein
MIAAGFSRWLSSQITWTPSLLQQASQSSGFSRRRRGSCLKATMKNLLKQAKVAEEGPIDPTCSVSSMS